MGTETYTKVPNDIMEGILCKGLLSKRESQIFCVILRERYNGQWTVRPPSVQKIADFTRLDRANVSTTIGQMLKKNIIRQRDGRKGRYYQINTDPPTWITKGCQNNNKKVLKQQQLFL